MRYIYIYTHSFSYPCILAGEKDQAAMEKKRCWRYGYAATLALPA